MTASAPDQADDLGPQIDAMLADAEQRADAAPAGPEDEDFKSEVHSAVGEDEARAVAAARQRAALHAPADSPDTAQPTPATIDELDEQLADSAPDEDDLPAPSAEQAPAAVEHQTLDQMREEVAEALTAAPMEEEPAPTPRELVPEEPLPEPEPEPAPIRAAAPVAEPPEPETSEPEPAPRRPSALLSLLRAIPLALAWPLSFLPPSARDQVGWLALVTLFNAGAVWVYLLLRH